VEYAQAAPELGATHFCVDQNLAVEWYSSPAIVWPDGFKDYRHNLKIRELAVYIYPYPYQAQYLARLASCRTAAKVVYPLEGLL
jgi:hypothetical protein